MAQYTLQDEIKRKQSLGKPLNNGVPVPHPGMTAQPKPNPAPQPSPKIVSSGMASTYAAAASQPTYKPPQPSVTNPSVNNQPANPSQSSAMAGAYAAAAKVPQPPAKDQFAPYGGKDKYTSDQQNRYNQAVTSGDTGLQQRLLNDAKRAGYNLSTPKIEETTPVPDPNAVPAPAPAPVPMPDTNTYVPPANPLPVLTPEDIQAEADARAAAAIQARTTAANQAKTGINTSYDRMQQNITQDRNLQDNYNGRQLSPFSGRSDFALGMQAMERGRSDRESQQDLQTRLANIDVSLQDFVNATDEQRQAMINEITRQERDYGLQVDNRKYGQWADQRNFGYGQFQDMVGWTGYVPPGGYGPNAGGLAANNAGPATFAAQFAPGEMSGAPIRTLQGVASDRAGQQQHIDTALAYGDRAGMILSPQDDPSGYLRQIQAGKAPLTYAAQTDQRDYNRGVLESDRGYNRGVLESDRNYGRGVLESDRGYNRGVLESDRNYNRGALESDRSYGLQEDGLYLNYMNAMSKDANGGDTVSAASAGTLLGKAITKINGYDDNGKAVYAPITDPVKREQAFLDAWNVSGIAAGADTIEMLTKAGYSTQEIAKLKEKYQEAFNAGTAASAGNGSGNEQTALKGGVADYAPVIDNYAMKYGVDPALMKAIIHHETGNLSSPAARNKYNFGGIMGKNGLNSYGSPEAGIEAVAKLLSTSRYKGKSIAQIGAIYAPINAGNDPNGLNRNWVSGVSQYYQQYRR